MLVIAGLGNPGQQYENTRHNAGFMALNLLAQEGGFQGQVNFGQSLISRGRLQSENVVLVWPQTYMNLSGPAVSKVLSFYKTDLNDFILLHDEMDLEPGLIKLTKGGGAAGHNGVSSVIKSLGVSDFAKIKIGIGRPPKGQASEGHVLSPFYPNEIALFNEGLQKAAQACRLWAEEGFVEAQNLHNRRPQK